MISGEESMLLCFQMGMRRIRPQIRGKVGIEIRVAADVALECANAYMSTVISYIW